MKEKLVYARTVLHLSQQALAQKLGVSFATVNRWENGHCTPSRLHEIRFERFCRENEVVFEKEKMGDL